VLDPAVEDLDPAVEDFADPPFELVPPEVELSPELCVLDLPSVADDVAGAVLEDVSLF
jgi:hypothetical protein